MANTPDLFARRRRFTSLAWVVLLCAAAAARAALGAPTSDGPPAGVTKTVASPTAVPSAKASTSAARVVEVSTVRKGPPLRVGIAGNAPWLVIPRNQGTPDGFSVRLWQAVAEKMGVAYKFVVLPDLEHELQAVIDGSIDVAVGPIGITSQRATRIAFTQPYFTASLGILTFAEPATLWERIRPFISAAFAALVAGLLLIVFVVGNVIWLVERHHNPGIPKAWPAGVANGMWMAVVTMTTVGYGDRVPVTTLGRVCASIWMIIATVMVSTLTASLTTALTVSNLGSTNIKSAEGLAGKRVAVLAGSLGERFARGYHADLMRTENLTDALHLLDDRRVDAVVTDEPSLRFYILGHPSLHLTLLVASFDVQSFGYAMPLESKLVRDLNVTLLGITESATMQQLKDLWFSDLAVKMSDPALLPQSTPASILPPTTNFTPSTGASGLPDIKPLPAK